MISFLKNRALQTCAGFFLVLLSNFNANAQFNETIRADRPGQGISGYAVGSSVLQIEPGLQWGGARYDASAIKMHFTEPNATVRFGITEHMEINASFAYRREKYFETGGANEPIFTGVSLASFGTRVNIYEGEDAIPSLAFQASLNVPRRFSDFSQAATSPTITLISEEKLNDEFTLALNLGANYDGNNIYPEYFYTLSLGYSVSSKLSVYVESFGNLQQKMFENRYDAGVAFLATNNLQLDIYGGAGKNDGTFDYFGNAGIAWRWVQWHNQKFHPTSKS